VPPSLDPDDRLVAAGKVQQPRQDRKVDLRKVRRPRVPVTSEELLADPLGDR
jgi:hypothetical protein